MHCGCIWYLQLVDNKTTNKRNSARIERRTKYSNRVVQQVEVLNCLPRQAHAMPACVRLHITIHNTTLLLQKCSCPCSSDLPSPAAAAAAALKLLLVLMVWCIGVVLPVNYTVRPDSHTRANGTWHMLAAVLLGCIGWMYWLLVHAIGS
jgi:hypothetical protein